MRRKRNTSCIYTGLVGRKMSVPKPRVSRRIYKRKVKLSGGPLDGVDVWLDADAGADHKTLSLAPLRGFPAGSYISATWTPEQHEALQDNVQERGRLAEVL